MGITLVLDEDTHVIIILIDKLSKSIDSENLVMGVFAMREI